MSLWRALWPAVPQEVPSCASVKGPHTAHSDSIGCLFCGLSAQAVFPPLSPSSIFTAEKHVRATDCMATFADRKVRTAIGKCNRRSIITTNVFLSRYRVFLSCLSCLKKNWGGGRQNPAWGYTVFRTAVFRASGALPPGAGTGRLHLAVCLCALSALGALRSRD